jgi:hypothetical protein
MFVLFQHKLDDTFEKGYNGIVFKPESNQWLYGVNHGFNEICFSVCDADLSMNEA